MNSLCARVLLPLTVLAAFTGPAAATIVTSVPVGIDAKVVTFSPYEGFTTARQLTTPIDVGTAETGESVLLDFNSTDPDRILGNVSQSFGANGNWPANDNGAYAGLNTASGFMTFAFSRGMNFVGGFMNFSSTDSNATITAFDLDFNEIIDSTSLSNVVDGQFLGISSDMANIGYLVVSGGFFSIDNVTFGTLADGTVPTPPTLALVAAALAALTFTRRRAA